MDRTSRPYKKTSIGWFDSPPIRNTFADLLQPLADHDSPRLLEIGCWEGVSACSFLDLTGENSTIVCVDPFTGSKEHNSPTHLEQFFDYNVNLAGYSDRVEKIRSESSKALPILAARCQQGERRFDFAYIDGSHIASDVLFDAVLVHQIVAGGGLIVFDDYLWTDLPDLLDRPKIAIDAYLSIYAREVEVIHQDFRVFLRKSI